MILSSIIIILREALEAALLVSLLLALSNRLELSKYWMTIAFGVGLVGSILFAVWLAPITSSFNGTGQELLNAGLHLLITATLIVVVYCWFGGFHNNALTGAMVIAVAAAVVREGSEIWIYYSSFLSVPEIFLKTLIGGTLGLLIGVSVGALLYYTLTLLRTEYNRWISIVLLTFVAAGMTSQAINSLIQADYLSATVSVWDSSTIVDENSITGQLLYALMGYEATPMPAQLLSYVLIVVAFLGTGIWMRAKSAG